MSVSVQLLTKHFGPRREIVGVEGVSFEAKGVRIEILDATPTYVVRARVTKLPEPEESD